MTINRRVLARFTTFLPPAPAALSVLALALSVLALHPVSARPVLHLAASLLCEMGGQLCTVQALGEAWSMGGKVGVKHCPLQVFERQECRSPEHQTAEFSAGVGFVLFWGFMGHIFHHFLLTQLTGDPSRG